MSHKKPALMNDPNNMSDESDSSDEGSDQEVYSGHEEIQVDFEGRNPTDSDFHGIKQLLNQLFLKAHINLSELSDLLIGQNYIGSVVKQSDADPDEDEDDEMTDINDVFGITSVINITQKKNLECVQQLRKLLVELAEQNATDTTNKLIQDILNDEENCTGLLINERFINIPAQISVPLLENLQSEINRAVSKKMPYKFVYYILICKLYKNEQTKKKKSKKSEPDVIWSNPEEEYILPEALASFEFSVKSEADSGLGGDWKEGDSEMTPYRKIMILRADSLPRIIETIKTQMSGTA
ncbi:protein BCCIP homolog [Ctenocephalides felis]|uniref:protein BCCIP homolog n=1 Tax=Ctenocephalides felis TaxID=7515 RepID=UPI000E6E2A84|nr:protein BCCIP homolog [Ctenocephalides felis]